MYIYTVYIYAVYIFNINRHHSAYTLAPINICTYVQKMGDSQKYIFQ